MINRQGRYVEGQEKYDAALALYTQTGDLAGQLETTKLRANLGSAFGEDRAKRPLLEQLLAGWRQLGERRGEATLISSLSGRYLHEDDPLRAVAYEQRALALREALGNRRAIADSLETLAGYYRVLGDV